VGAIRLVRGVGRENRVFAAWALGSGLFAAAAWGAAVSGLPPSSAVSTIRDAFRSWDAFRVFASRVFGTTLEFLSPPFTPEAVYRGLPFVYDGSTWGHWGIIVLCSVAGLLLAAWIRRPRERLRISAIAGCLLAFLLLTIVLHLSRGVYGPSAGASAR